VLRALLERQPHVSDAMIECHDRGRRARKRERHR
jgi:hypothetical protein